MNRSVVLYVKFSCKHFNSFIVDAGVCPIIQSTCPLSSTGLHTSISLSWSPSAGDWVICCSETTKGFNEEGVLLQVSTNIPTPPTARGLRTPPGWQPQMSSCNFTFAFYGVSLGCKFTLMGLNIL